MSISLEELEERLDKLGGPGMERVLNVALERAGLRGMKEAKLSVTRSGKQRTGNLRSSIRHEVRTGKDGNAEMALRAGGAVTSKEVVYARIQEDGGTVTPKRGKFLAIPMGEGAMTPAGVARYASAREYPGILDYIPTERGAVLVDPVLGTIQYALVRSVTIKGRHFMRDGMRKAKKGVGKDILKGLAEAITEGKEPRK